ncbi:C7 [Branchiostoma lanceolatum]|uniref:C7 protein n=1 Tax=Branchiostoma lanceolatum TaxID=7740 RepID=A0A8J9YJQ9_BRALA|nr:C7 [Branchiostoma lanceolatum]
MKWSRFFGVCVLATFFTGDSEGHERRRPPGRQVDCVWSNWSSWTLCSSCHEQQTRTRSVAQHASYGGRECIGSSWDSRPCSQLCHNGATVGSCPAEGSGSVGSCYPYDTCQTDRDCPGGRLCCPKRCWTWVTVCEEPALPATEATPQQQAVDGDDNSLEILKVVLPAVMTPVSLIVVAIIVVRCRPNNAVGDSSTAPNNAAGVSSAIAEDAATIVGLATLKTGDPPPPYTPQASTGMPPVSTL